MTVRNCTLGDVHCLNHVFKSNPKKILRKILVANQRKTWLAATRMMIIPARNVTITAGFPQVWICYLNKHKFQAYFWRASARVFWTKIMGAIFEGWGRERNLYLGNGRRSKIRSGVGVGMWRFIYIIHACWLVLTCDLFEDRRIDDVIVNDIVLFFFYQIKHWF